MKIWDQQNYLVIRGFCYISDLFITRFHCNLGVGTKTGQRGVRDYQEYKQGHFIKPSLICFGFGKEVAKIDAGM